MTLLLLACSARKSRDPNLLPARDRYEGSLFRSGLSLAKLKDWSVLILSAQFGFIEPDALIPYYDTRFSIPYSGFWPNGQGFYLGGQDYFVNAPTRFKPLVTGRGTGDMTQQVQKMLRPGMRSGQGVVYTLFEALVEGPKTKQELRELLLAKFPHGHPKMVKTVDIQLNQRRIGDEREHILMKDGPAHNKRYWLVPK